MTWAARRRLMIVLIILLALGGFAWYKLYPVFHKVPICTDNIKNGDETGIDCGGSCTLVCTAEVTIPNVLWSRSFAVTDTVYNAVAYVENRNAAATKAIPYEFRIYDTDGIFVARVQGMTKVPGAGHYAIVETGIAVGTSKVGRTTFEFSKNPVRWERVSDDAMKLNVLTNNLKLDISGSVPKLSANVVNPSPTITLSDTIVAAILYDANDNAVNVSRTIVPTLAPQASAPIYFTWPRAFSAPVVRYQLVPIIDIFSAH